MQTILNSFQRIGVIFAITYRESVRRKLVWIFVISCVLFSLCGSCSAKVISIMSGDPYEKATKFLEENPSREAFIEKEVQLLKERGAPDEYLEMMKPRLGGEYDAMVANASKEFQEKENEKSMITVTGISFALFALWCYLLASLFTPFIALNDFYTKSHVLLLASPLERYEYLAGKFLAIVGMVGSSLLLMVLTYHIGMLLVYGSAGWSMLRGIPILLFGLALYISMIMLLSLIMGRIPAVVISIAMLFITAIPAYPVLAEIPLEEQWSYWLRLPGYFMPQYGTNFLYGIIESMSGFESMQQQLKGSNLDFNQIGKLSHVYAMLANAGWLLGFSAIAAFIFQKRDLNT